MNDNENIFTRKVLFEKHSIKKRIFKREFLDLYPINRRVLLGDNYRYKTHKGEVSLLTPSTSTMGMYEIYCPELFEDIERYETLEDAEERIIELLN